MPLIRFQNLRYEECKDEVFALTENAVDGMRVVKPSALSRWLFRRIPTWNFPFFRPIVTSNIYLNSCSTYWTPWSRELTMAAGTGAGAGAGAASLGGGELDRCPSVPLPRTFDKTEFDCDLHITALRIPAKECQHYMKLLSRYAVL